VDTPLVSRGLTRRQALRIGASFTGGALLVGCSVADVMSMGARKEVGPFGPFIKVTPDGWVTVVAHHIELGQGSPTGLAAIVAEEMDADWSKVRLEQAPANAKLYGNAKMAGLQGTGGSTAIASSWTQLRTAGAAARAMFVQAAAKAWNTPTGEITVKDGVVSHAPSGRAAPFQDLLEAAAKVSPPQAPALKDPKAFTLIGTDRVRRKDALAKSTGAARFTQDVHLPDMLTAMVAHSPRFGGKVAGFDASAARRIPGVVDVFQIPTGVAVVAENTWAARQGRDALVVRWDDSLAEMRSTDQIAAWYRDLASGQATPADLKWQPFVSRGEAAAAARGKAVVETTYDFPYLAHAAMEPMNCVASVDGRSAHLITGSQLPTIDQLNTAKIVGNLPGAISIDTLFAGGSFGRRANFQSDYVAECVHIAKQVGRGRPVKLVWTREDDMTAGHYRPLIHHAVRVTVDRDGFPATWRHRLVTQSILKAAPMPPGKLDRTAVEGAQDSPYLKATPVVDAQVILPDGKVPVQWWRSVGATHNAFVMEHTIDQLAKAANKDPVAYRRALYARAGAHRHRAALDLAAEKAGWGAPAPAGWTRGVAVHESFGSVVAQVAEVRLEDGVPRVGRVVTAIDCGVAVAPDQIAAQMEGGTCFGLSAALFGQITLKNGLVEQTNFDAYRVLRHAEAPTVETWIVPSANPPSGVGEPGTPVIAPAVAGALLAMGQPPTTSLPFVRG
jgi:isoquinoline 1-oxidoreductase beta subunit